MKVTPIPVPYKIGPDWEMLSLEGKPLNIRKDAPFRPGDVIFVSRMPGEYGIAKVIRIDSYYLTSKEYRIPVYRVVMVRPDGTFMENPRRTLRMYPGDVFRGYKLANRPQDKFTE